MQAQPSNFFHALVNLVKQDPSNSEAAYVAAKETSIKVISFKNDPLYCIFTFKQVAYQIRKTKKGFECAAFGVTKH